MQSRGSDAPASLRSRRSLDWFVFFVADIQTGFGPIRETLENLMRGRTVIAIAHRLSTLRNLDRILLLQKGGLVEDGARRRCCAVEAPTTAWSTAN